MKTVYLVLCLILFNCVKDSNNLNTNQDSATSVWCVAESDIGGGISFFPYIDNPTFNSVPSIETLNYLNDNSKLALLKINNQVYVFPFDYTNYYEVINLNFENDFLALTYCPLTQSAICFDRSISNNTIVNLKASGYLYKNNLVPMDIETNSYWSQMSTNIVRGDDKDIELKTYNIVETAWSIVKNHFPNALVFNHENINNCGNCNNSNTPLNFNNKYGIINEHVLNDTVHLFDFNTFLNFVNTEYATINNKNTIIVGSKNKVFINSFYIPTGFSFTALDESEFPLILSDNYGNKWDLFGFAIEGPNTGQKLNSPKSYFAAQWAWDDFFENQNNYN